ncbi:MAG: hypothetical protein RSA93_08640 [Longicatena sp.]
MEEATVHFMMFDEMVNNAQTNGNSDKLISLFQTEQKSYYDLAKDFVIPFVPQEQKGIASAKEQAIQKLRNTQCKTLHNTHKKDIER